MIYDPNIKCSTCRVKYEKKKRRKEKNKKSSHKCKIYIKLEEERVNKDQHRRNSGNLILELEPSSLATKGNLLALPGWMGNASLRVTVQQILTIGDSWRVNCI